MTSVVDAIESEAVEAAAPAARPGTPEWPRERYWGILRRQAVVRRSLALADSLAIFGALLGVYALGGPTPRLKLILAAPVFILIAKASGLYDRDEHVLHKTTLDEVPRLFAIATVMTLVLTLCDGLVVRGSWTSAEVVALWGLLTVLLVSFRTVGRAISAATQQPERCLVIGDQADADFLRNQIELTQTIRAVIVGAVGPSQNGSHDPGLLPPGIGELIVEERIDRVIVTQSHVTIDGADQVLDALQQLRGYGVRISLLPRGPQVARPAAELDHLPGVTLLGIRGLDISRSSRFVKRGFDVVGTSVGGLLLSPLWIAIAVAIKLDSRGPVLFRQQRVGRHGREFTMVKFRSMVSEADQLKEELRDLNEGGTGLFKIAADPRVTRVGRILRRLSLDELPQLWNVLRGEMSLIGPRPLIREEDGLIEGLHRRRLEVRPGMTGHWQILCSARRITLAEMARLDYLYVANWSLWSDIRLLLRTVPFVVGGRGV